MATKDKFEVYTSNLDSPASNAVAATPSDSVDFPFASRGLYIGGSGDVRVDMQHGAAPVTFLGVMAVSILPIRVSRVYATGTTATGIVALY